MGIEVGSGFGGLVGKYKQKMADRKKQKLKNRKERHAEWRAAAKPAQLATRFNTEAYREGHAAIDWSTPLVICSVCQRFNCEAHGGKEAGDALSGPDSAADRGLAEDPRPEDSTGGASWCP